MGNVLQLGFTSFFIAESPAPPLIRPVNSARVDRGTIWSIRASAVLYGLTLRPARTYGLILKVKAITQRDDQLRTQSGATADDEHILAIINPVNLNPDLIQEVRRLELEAKAKVKVIFSGNDWHHQHLNDWATTFPDANVYVVSDRVLRKQPNLPIVARNRLTVLDRQEPSIPEFAEEITLVPFLGLAQLPRNLGGDRYGTARVEVVVFHKKAQLMFFTDSAFAPKVSPHDASLIRNPVALEPDVGVPALDLYETGRSCQRILELNPKHLTFAHAMTTNEVVFSLNDDDLQVKVERGPPVPPVRVILEQFFRQHYLDPPPKTNGSSGFFPLLLKIALFLSYVAFAVNLMALSMREPAERCSLPEKEVYVSTIAVVKNGYQLSFEDFLSSAGLVKKAREFRGNIDYQVVQSVDSPSQYQIVEKWVSLEHWKQWQESAIALKSFNSTVMKSMLQGGKASSPYPYVKLTPATCKSQETGAYNFVVQNNCGNVIKILRHTGSCFWIPGCEYSSFETNLESKSPKRAVYMRDGRIFHAYRKDINKFTFSYNLPDGSDELSGFTSAVALHSHQRDSCLIVEQFSLPRSSALTGSAVLDDLKSQITGLENLLGKLEKSLT